MLGRARSIDQDPKETKTEYITMNGKDVFQFAVRKVPQVIKEVLKENELSTEDIDWFVLHQANARIVDAVARRLRLDIGKFPMNLQDYGNTSSASIPILLNELNRKGVLKKDRNWFWQDLEQDCPGAQACWTGTSRSDEAIRRYPISQY